MRKVTIIFNGTEWVAITRVSIMTTVRGFGDTQAHACKELLVNCRHFPNESALRTIIHLS